MSEALEYKVRCNFCNKEFTLKGKECFRYNIYCEKCNEDFENLELDIFLKKVIKKYIPNKVSYQELDHKILLDTKNSALFLGIFTRDNYPDIDKISSLCRKKILLGYQKSKGSKWRVNICSLYFYQRKLKKESIGLSTRMAAEKLSISIYEIRRRIKLPRNDPLWINSEKKNPDILYSKYIVYFEN